MTESQRQFEEWLNGEFDTAQVNGMPVYASFVVQRMWDAWQASRAAVVVNTATMKDPSYEATGMVYLDSVENALYDAGIRYE